MSRPHWVLFTLFCLTFGLLTTLAVAWGAPVLAARASRPPTWSNAQFWIDDTYAGHYQLAHSRFADHVRFLHIIFEGQARDKPYYKATPPPPWAFKLTQAMEGEDAAAGTTWWGVDTLATGWPLRAFRGGVYEPWPTGRPSVPTFTLIPDGKGGLTVAPPAAPAGPLPLNMSLYRFGGKNNDQYSIPLRPIPRGLALNTIFFGAAWGLVFLTLARVRGATRRRRRRCPACNYDLRGLTVGARCPECGKPRRVPRGAVS